jgi:esterase/lipase superfamily enzyme
MISSMIPKDTWLWPTARLPEAARVARWGSFGRPVLLFPSAGGDCMELERQGVIGALAPLLEAGRIKLYSVDSIAARAWLKGRESAAHRSRIQNGFDAWVREELVPHVHRDCGGDRERIVVGGAYLGAFNAIASLCRHPEVFDSAVCLSGRYDLTGYLDGAMDPDFYFSSPLHYLPGLGDSTELALLRTRAIWLACGSGRYEEPDATTRMARLVEEKGISHRLELWGDEFDHDWPTWRAMLSKYLAELA